MVVNGPINRLGAVTDAAAPGKGSVESSEAVRVVRALAVPTSEHASSAKSAPREDVREVTARIAERLEKYLKDSGRNVEYRVDAAAGATVITVRRADSGEVVRQFPSEEALAWLQRLNEQSGTFLDALA